MILDKQHEDAFREYTKPLRKLERTLNRNRETYRFHAFVAPLGIKMVRVSVRRVSVEALVNKTICVEWASPAQAVEIVAAGVKV